MTRQQASQGDPARRKPWIIAGAAAGAVALALIALQGIRASTLGGEILRGDPDVVAQRPDLVRFAAAEARPIYARNCASCHGADMKGDRNRGAPDLIDQDWLYGSGRPAEIERTILYGIRASLPRTWNLADMPAFGEAKPYRRYKVAPLTPGDIRDVVEFLRVLEQKPADPVAAARGGKVFADTGQCFDCHSNDGYGDQAIGAPNLHDDIWLYGDGSRESLFKSIAHGRAGVCPAWSKRLKPVQVRALAIYLATTAKTSKPAQQQGKPS